MTARPPDAPPPIPAPWTPLVRGVAAPSAVFLLGLLVMFLHRPSGGYVLILWPITTIAGMALGSSALLQRLMRSERSTPLVFLITGLFALACLALQAGLAVWLAERLRGQGP